MADAVIAAVLTFLAFFAGAISGFGAGLLAVPVFVWYLASLPTAVVVMNALGLVQSGLILASNHQHVVWSEFRRMAGWAGAGLPLGILGARHMPERELLIALGAMVTLSALAQLFKRPVRFPPKLIEPGLNSLLFSGGVIHGAFGTGGATVAIYTAIRVAAKDSFRSTFSAFWVFMNVAMLTAMGFQGFIDQRALIHIAIGLPIIFVANQLGEVAQRCVNQQRFTKWVALLLLIAGVSTLARYL